MKASCLDKIGYKIFSKNPWIIVKNKKIIKEWIKNKKVKEVLLSKENQLKKF